MGNEETKAIPGEEYDDWWKEEQKKWDIMATESYAKFHKMACVEDIFNHTPQSLFQKYGEPALVVEKSGQFNSARTDQEQEFINSKYNDVWFRKFEQSDFTVYTAVLPKAPDYEFIIRVFLVD